jgi:type IX secretion system PorP/SprF family membrane protein
MKKILIFVMATFLIKGFGFAQLGTPLSQFSGNQMVYNPGYIGIYDLLSINASVHQSWTGMQGAPFMLNLNGHAPFKNQKHAWGWTLQNEKWGPLQGNFALVNYAHKIYLRNGVLNLGLQAGVLIHTTDWDKIDYVEDWTDPTLGQGRMNDVKFDANIGAYYMARQWYMGFSVLHINNPKYGIIKIEGTDWYSQMQSQFVFMGGFNIQANDIWSIRPEVFMRYLHNTPVSVNVGAHVHYKNIFSIGSNFLTGQKGVSFQAKFTVSDRFRIGYSYDTFFGAIKPYQHGSHEIGVNYLIRDLWKKDRTVNLLWL